MVIWIFVVVLMCVSHLVPVAFAETSESTLRVTTTDFQFSPKTWSVTSGEQVSLAITNTGKQDHEWVLLKPGTEVTIPFDDDDEAKVFWEIEAKPGESKTEAFVAPAKPGTYDIVCGKPRHIERGMKATLVIK